MSNHPYRYRGETETLDDAARAALPGQFVVLPDGIVHYELAGPPGGPVVVLVPGISVPYTTWDANFPALANAGLRVLRFDLYGRGYSDRPDVVYDIDLFDRQIVDLLSALGLGDPLSLVGLSMGGAVVTHFAARRPERMRRLVLIDPLSATPAATLPIKMALAPGLGERLMDWFGNRILVGGQSQDFYRSELVAEFQEKYRPPMKYGGFKNAILSTVRSIPGWRIAEAYEQVGRAQYPVLLFWGRQDRAIPFETHRKVMDLIPRAEFHAIDNAGHVPHVEQPDTLNPPLIKFLCR
jgi:pimeloyl-ACP methyl ester carboxylesterase